ncbi:hypothetical protein K3G39_06855 [Pontibacter sp. HSC-14F20]|uniref:hypothetical protein n=1 Tax=Pontibacter sp. HSC-14F20 TaxID=2864136 RepID=UPI001C73DBC0|nr:hypothetical protein [Pontibacter sp. HSC-14F20]MBX0332952.1 hypothetical protein [Pontibacter sp. HSC-14F20]
MDLLLAHTDAVLAHSPYYHSRIFCFRQEGSADFVPSFPLGPYLEFWREVPLNNAAKLYLTYELLRFIRMQDLGIRDLFEEAPKTWLEELLEETGFMDRDPMPGISRSQLADILRRYMRQFKDVEQLPVGAPLWLVVQELQQSQVPGTRKSNYYGMLRSELRDATQDLTGIPALYCVPEPSAGIGHAAYESGEEPQQAPVTFRVEPQHNGTIQLVVELAVSVKHLYYPPRSKYKGAAAALNDKLIGCLKAMEPLLEKAGFTKLKSYTSVSGKGLEGLFTHEITDPEAQLGPSGLADFALLLRQLYEIIAANELSGRGK